jgi:L-serine kinase (ADP)
VIRPVFRLLRVEELREHEQVDPRKVEELRELIRASGAVDEPIWVAERSGVVLNGHHRFQALRSLGARRVPAWVFDYDDPEVRIGRWSPGPPITKEEVVRRAKEGRPFPPKTTRHTLTVTLAPKVTPLSELEGEELPRPRPGARRAAPD